MPASSVVGSLYYEVILDPLKFSRGATKVVKDQKLLRNAIRKTAKEMDPAERLRKETDAELEAIRKAKLSAEERKLLIDGVVDHHERRMEEIRLKEEETNAARVAAWERAEAKIRRAGEIAARERMEHAVSSTSSRIANRNTRAYSNMMFAGGEGHTGDIFGQIRAMGEASRAANSFTGRLEKMRLGVQSTVFKLFPLYVAFTQVNAVMRSIIGTTWEFISAADEKKKSLLTLQTLYGGNLEVAKELRKELVRYGQKTSFSVQGTVELAKTMRTLGYDAKETIKWIEIFGKLSFGDEGKLKLIAKAMSDVKGAEKLRGQELQQFVNQSVPILKSLGEVMGKTTGEVRAAMEAGEVSLENVEAALEKLAGEYGDTDVLGLQTATGQMDRMKDTWDEFKASMGTGDGPVKVMRMLADEFERTSDALTDIKENGFFRQDLPILLRGLGLGAGKSKAYGNAIGEKIDQTALEMLFPGLATKRSVMGLFDMRDSLFGMEGSQSDFGGASSTLNDALDSAAEDAKILADAEEKRLAMVKRYEEAIEGQRDWIRFAGLNDDESVRTIAEALAEMLESELESFNETGGTDSIKHQMNLTYQLQKAQYDRDQIKARYDDAVQKRSEAIAKEAAANIKAVDDSLKQSPARADSVEAWLYERQLVEDQKDREERKKQHEEIKKTELEAANKVVEAIKSLSKESTVLVSVE